MEPRINGINHVTLAVGDVERSSAFYRDLLGCREVAVLPNGRYLTADGLWLVLLDSDNPGPSDNYSHIAFNVSGEFGQLAQRLRDAGVPIWQANQSHGDSLYFLDPDGYRLEIHASTLLSRLQSNNAKIMLTADGEALVAGSTKRS